MNDLTDEEAPDDACEESLVSTRPVDSEIPQIVEQEILGEYDQEVGNKNELAG